MILKDAETRLFSFRHSVENSVEKCEQQGTEIRAPRTLIPEIRALIPERRAPIPEIRAPIPERRTARSQHRKHAAGSRVRSAPEHLSHSTTGGGMRALCHSPIPSLQKILERISSPVYAGHIYAATS